MKILNFFIWVLPFLVLVCAYFGFRSNAHKRIRYLVYAVVLFIAFLFDLMGISFKADQFDSVLKLMVLFIVSEVCWNFLRLKNRIAASAHIAGSFVVFFLAYSGGFTADIRCKSYMESGCCRQLLVRRNNVCS